MQDKLDQINEKLSSIDRTLAVNTAELSHHIEQTNILRDEVKVQRSELDDMKRDFTKVKSFFMHIGWIISTLAMIVGAAYQIHNLLGIIIHR